MMRLRWNEPGIASVVICSGRWVTWVCVRCVPPCGKRFDPAAWEYAASTTFLSDEGREALRRQVMVEYGEGLELIDPA